MTMNNATSKSNIVLVEKIDKHGRTPLHYAAKANDVKTKEGANVYAKNKKGNPPLYYAFYNDTDAVTDLLSEAMSKCDHGQTPLHDEAEY